MHFGRRLIVFLVATLLMTQALTGWAIYSRLRAMLTEDGKDRVVGAASRFVHDKEDREDVIAAGLRLLSLDGALRRSVALGDASAAVQVLRERAIQLGAPRLLMIGEDGTIDADTAGDPAMPAQHFPFPGLMPEAQGRASAHGVAMFLGKPVCLVAVRLPEFGMSLVAVVPLDDGRLDRWRALSGVPGTIGLAVASGDAWQPAAGRLDAAWLRVLPRPGQPGFATSAKVAWAVDKHVVTMVPLPTTPGSQPVAAVLSYPLAAGLQHYRRLLMVMFAELAVGLMTTIIGTVAIARSVVRPVELLARQMGRIEAGDYTSPVLLPREDELGRLSLGVSRMVRAISEREDRIRHQATHDLVTGLPNRQALLAAVDTMLRDGGGALLAVSLLRWEEVANTVGRDIADRLMRDAAARMRRLIGVPTLGCSGERSLAVFLPGADTETARQWAATLIETFELPYHEGDLTIDMGAAIGIALAPEHGTEAALLLRRAEVALRLSLRGETHSAVYQPDSDPHRPDLLSLMSDLRHGLQNGELRLLYQPRIDLASGAVCGAEALVRWFHPVRGVVPVESFISVAEETGNIPLLTRWVLETGLAEAQAWRRQGAPARVSINLSVRDLSDPDLPSRVAALLERLGQPAGELVLEITESAIMGEPDAAIAALHRLSALGIDLAIDDFGVGQSSLAYLRRLPVRVIKIDKAFVLRLPHSQDDQTIVRSVIELGHNLGYRVTAEGVEDAASLAMLRSFGCDEAQGYYIARPLSGEAFRRFAASWPGLDRG